MLAAFSPLLICSEAGVFIMSNILTFKTRPACWLALGRLHRAHVLLVGWLCVTNLLCDLADPGRGTIGKVRPSGVPAYWRRHALIRGDTCRDRKGGTESQTEKGPLVVNRTGGGLSRLCSFSLWTAASQHHHVIWIKLGTWKATSKGQLAPVLWTSPLQQVAVVCIC